MRRLLSLLLAFALCFNSAQAQILFPILAGGAPNVTSAVWVNNQNGTGTWTITTDVSTTASGAYGSTNSYGTSLSDGAGTSHAFTISANDALYFLRMTLTGSNGTASTTALGNITNTALGHFFVWPHALAGTTQLDRWLMPLSNHDGTANGLVLQFRELTGSFPGGPATGTGHYVYQAYEGEMRPGYMFPFTPDTITGTVGAAYSDSPWRGYNLRLDGSKTCWNVPTVVSSANGFNSAQADSLVVFGDAAADGHWEIHRIRGGSGCSGGSDTTIVADLAPAGSGFVAAEVCPTCTVSISAGNELQAGDILYVRTKAGSGTQAKIASIQLYSSSGTFPTGSTAHRIMRAGMQTRMTQLQGNGPTCPGVSCIWITGSSTENAWTMGPHSSTAELVGGYAHQGGSDGSGGNYGEETSISESWVKGGSGWSVVQGYVVDTLAFTHTSTSFYNLSNTNIGSIAYTLTPQGWDVKDAALYTTNVTVDSGALFAPMLPVTNYTNIAVTLDGTTNASPATRTQAGVGTFTPTNVSNVGWVSGTSVSAGIGVFYTPLAGSTVTSYNTQGAGKYYQQLAPASATSTPASTSYSGGGNWFSLPAAGPVKPSLTSTSCTVNVDGVTILCKFATRTRAVSGTTGLTFKRSGSSITGGATITNNGDNSVKYVLTPANVIHTADTITVDTATTSFYDSYNIMAVAASGTAVVNGSLQ